MGSRRLACLVAIAWSAGTLAQSPSAQGGAAAATQPRGYTIPVVDLAGDTARQVVVDREDGQYLGHPTTVLLEDGRTMIAVYPKGHGRGAIVMKRSADGGRTWSPRLPTPASWETSLEVPTIYRTVDAKGTRRLILFSGLYPIRLATSSNDGATWSELAPIGQFGGIVAMSSLVPLRTGRGHYMALFHDDGRFIGEKPPEGARVFRVYKTMSSDGGLTWSAPEVIATHPQAQLCEPGAVRSPDGRQIAVLLRENSRTFNSFVILSNDEGRTWSEPREVSAALTGDRHTAKYGPDGRLFVTFRDMTRESSTPGDWVGWVGTYDDIIRGREGQYRVRLMKNHDGSDCAYPGLELLPDGRRLLGVHIADVSHFVSRDGPIDREARERGNSVYLPDKVLPMLPEQLSNGLCSLKPGQDRFTVSVMITVDAEGRPIAHDFARSVIRSRLRLNYEQAMRALRTPEGMRCEDPEVDPEAMDLLRGLNRLAQQFRARRFTQYALDLDMPDYEIIIGKTGMISEVRKLVNDPSHQLIEECMVAANEAVDRHLTHLGLPLLHRIHEPPAPEKIVDLETSLRNLGYSPGALGQRRQMSEFLKSVRNDPLNHHIQTAILRSMKRAVYASEPRGHYGLAKKLYTHFTSPIRRYPDLIVHRILGRALDSAPSLYGPGELAALGDHCSRTEQTADEAERFLVEIKKYRFLEQQLQDRKPLTYDAVVVNVRNFGMFVEILDLQVQGLVHVSAISQRIVNFDPAREMLRDGANSYAVGTKVKVFVVKVDFDQRRLDFALSRERPPGGEARHADLRAPRPPFRASRPPARGGRGGS